MDLPSAEIIALLSYLVPGFMAAWVFRGLVSFPEQTHYRDLVQALIFTMLVQVFVKMIRVTFVSIGTTGISIGVWSSQVEQVWSVIAAGMLGLVFAYLTNGDCLHSILRRYGVTNQNAYPSEWFSAFKQHPAFVVLHLKGERRLYGWPEEWPTDPSNGHFSIAEPEWLTEDERLPLSGVERIVVPTNQVEMVELMRMDMVTTEEKHGKEPTTETTEERR